MTLARTSQLTSNPIGHKNVLSSISCVFNGYDANEGWKE